MRRIRSCLVTFAVLGSILLAGCAEQSVTAPRQWRPASTPVFATDEEALDAAVAAYEHYLAVSDSIAADGGANPERLKDLVTPEWYAKEVEGFEAIADAGMFQRGETTLDSAELQTFTTVGRRTEIVTYACTDFGLTSFVDERGNDVTPASRNLRVVFQITFAANYSGEVLVAGSEPWSASSC